MLGMDPTVPRSEMRRPRRRPGGELPALDGLRAVAVLSVMFFHFGVGAMRGGFLGVDVFFVLSGYLITGQLVTRWVLGGDIQLATFWLARARRLLPGLGAMLIGTTVAVLLLDRSQVGLFRGDVTAAATYSSNWWYIFHSRSYFAAAGRPPVLQHLWSLAVEEQFYLVWPLVVAAVVLAVRRPQTRRSVLLVITFAVALGSSLTMGVGSALSHSPQAGDPSRWYFGSDSHVMGLAIGAGLALVHWGDHLGSESIRPKKPASARETVAGTVALVALILMLAQTDEFSVWLYRWGFVAVSVLTAVVIAVSIRPGALAAVLSPPILRGIGKRSYGLYLWHWPVACFTRPGVDLPLSQNQALVLRLSLTFLLAEASYRWIEMPIRQRGWHWFWTSIASSRIGTVRAPTVITIGVTSLVTAVLIMPATAVTTGPDLASGGTVYVANPQPGNGVRRVGSSGGAGASVGGGATATRQSPSQKPATTPSSPAHSPNEQQSISQHPTTQTAPASRHQHSADTSGSSSSRSSGGSSRTPPQTVGPPRSASQLKHYDLAVYGDSVALGAVSDLVAKFRSVSNYATEGVQSWTLLPELTAAAKSGRFDGDVVLLHTGDNGVVERSQLDAALSALSGAARVIVAIPYVPRDWQGDNHATIESVAGRYPNVTLMDWDSVAQSHPGYLWSDSIHLTPTGEHAYTALVADAAVVPAPKHHRSH